MSNHRFVDNVFSRRWMALAAGILALSLAVLACSSQSINIPSNNVPSAGSVEVTPITPRVFQTTVDGVHLGDANAKAKIDVWEDFQCSSCLNFTQSIEPKIISGLVETGKAYYTFHFFPFIDGFSNSPVKESHNAADAALCANAQGRFWDYHDILYANWLGENAGSYTDARLAKMAETLGLDMTQFNQCYQAKQFSGQIDQDKAAGAAQGVQGTPSVFVNGTLLTPGYVPSYDQIASAVEAVLGK